ncbi:CPBP family intramembrane glutamic endopeptidase [Sphaerisporangium sp. B11E5]|uniref:CPBP family intramembrane glutamic endopeptidase n=1 Tax=Sphaerisporangium sp. B11E5 TaxID=3153563 RepID=UPI00325CC01B
MKEEEHPGGQGHLLPSALAVLLAANVMNNRVARRIAPLTSAAAAGTLLLLARRAGLTWEEMGFTRGRKGARIGGTLAAAVTAAYAGGVLLPATRKLFHDERALRLSRARLLEETLIQVPVGTVLLEEVAFRGVLPAALRRTHGPTTSVLASSALFGLWHVLPAVDMAAANPSLGGLAAAADPGLGDLAATAVPALADPAPASPGPDTLGPDTLGPDTLGPDTLGPDTLGPDTLGPDTLGPDTLGPGGPGPGGTKPGASARPPWTRRRGPALAAVVAGTVVSTTAAGVFFHELRRRGGLLAPSLTHLATNSLGFLAARAAALLPDRREDKDQGVGTTWNDSA